LGILLDAKSRSKPVLERIHNWPDYHGEAGDSEQFMEIRKHSNTGRPLGSEEFIGTIEDQTGRCLRKKRPGPK
jgi:putative transposase